MLSNGVIPQKAGPSFPGTASREPSSAPSLVPGSHKGSKSCVSKVSWQDASLSLRARVTTPPADQPSHMPALAQPPGKWERLATPGTPSSKSPDLVFPGEQREVLGVGGAGDACSEASSNPSAEQTSDRPSYHS